MSRLLLVYPFFRRSLDRSRFRFPPLGIAYLASAARQAGHEVSLLDCTFLSRAEAVRRVSEAGADAIGISCMATMLDDCLALAGAARDHCGLLIAGGPLATCEPQAFLEAFDVVVQGEGEHTLVEVLAHVGGRRRPGASAGRRRGRRRRARSSATSTGCRRRPASCFPTPTTSASGASATATRSRP